MPLKNREQKTCEGCLAVNLLNLTDINLTKEREMNILGYALKFSKKNFTIGHLDYIAKNAEYIGFFIDNQKVFEIIKKLDFSGKIELFRKKITLRLIDKLIKRQPVILYLDSFYLWGIKHYPHFVTIFENSGDKYEIFDPWDGERKFIKRKIISKSIIKLRNLLKVCPQAIQITK